MSVQTIIAAKPLRELTDGELVQLVRLKLGPVDTAQALAEELAARLDHQRRMMRQAAQLLRECVEVS